MATQSKIYFAKLYELSKRLIKFEKSLGILNNGTDNAYPERVERIINNSSTAKAAARVMSKYIAGKGVPELNKIIVNKRKNITLLRFIHKFAKSYTYQQGVFIHVNYNALLEIASLEVLPYTHCRLGKPDDEKYSGKIAVSSKFEDGDRIKPKDVKFVDVYNPNKEVIKKQIAKAGNLQKYKGQILFVNYSECDYPLATADDALNDADSEYRASLYKNTILRKGFFGKTLVITKPFQGSDLEYLDPSRLSEEDLYRLQKTRSERDDFEATMESFLGAENSDGILHLEMDYEGDDIDKQILFKNIDSTINDKTFAYTEESVRNNIRKAFNNIPLGLIDSTESSFFADTGRGILERQLFYQSQTEEEREVLEEVLSLLLKNLQDLNFPEEGIKITPLIERPEVTGSEKQDQTDEEAVAEIEEIDDQEES